MDHLTPEQVKRYQKQELSSAELSEFADHLFQCQTCRSQIRNTPEFQDAFASLQSQFPAQPPHASYEELSGYVDNTVDSSVRARVEKHLAGCRECAVQLQDLQAIQNSLKAIPFRTRPGAQRTRLLAAAAAAVFMVLLSAWLLSTRISKPQPGSHVQLAESILNDGAGRIVLAKDGKLESLPDVSPEMLALMKTAIQTKQLPVADISTLNPDANTLLGPQNAPLFNLSYPVGVVVISENPVFIWNPLPGAESYTVTVLGEALNEVETSPALTSTAWQSSAKLERGKTYTWQVTANKKGEEFTSPAPPAPEALFKVLEEERAREIIVAKQQHSPHLLLAILYAQAGLIEDARKEVEILRSQNPDSPIVSGLAKSLQSAH